MLLSGLRNNRYIEWVHGGGRTAHEKPRRPLGIWLMKYRDVERLLLDNGFVPIRQHGSHRHLQGFVDGKRRIVTLAHHSRNEDVLPKTLASIIRQSGLPKRLFK